MGSIGRGFDNKVRSDQFCQPNIAAHSERFGGGEESFGERRCGPSFIAPEQHQGFRAASPLVSSAVPLGLLFFFYEPVQLWNDQRHQLGRRFVRPIDLARVDHTVRFQRVLP